MIQEVQKLFQNYQDKKHLLIQYTQKYFLTNKIQPYVWVDEKHRLRIKQKYPRNIKQFENEQRQYFYKIIEQFCKDHNLKVRYIQETQETDTTLPTQIQSQWSTEFIIEVKK